MLDVSQDPYIAEQQVRAIAFMLVAFGYIDGEFDPRERDYVTTELDQLAERRSFSAELGTRAVLRTRIAAHQRELVDEYEATVRAHFRESVAEGESHLDFVVSKLKLGCLELLRHFAPALKAEIVGMVEKLMHADGRVDPREKAFFDDVVALAQAPIELDETEFDVLEAGAEVIEPPRPLAARMPNHPLFGPVEVDFPRDAEGFAAAAAGEIALCDRVRATLDTLRETGRGRLTGLATVRDLPEGERLLDGFVYAERPDPERRYELLVLGDLHGCYSCFKAALLQADFLEKARMHRERPDEHPVPRLVLLGDYIDRGRFGYSGTLRLAMQLLTQFPEYVVMLRGNHEYYVELNGRTVAPVRPCESIESLGGLDAAALVARYRELFDDLATAYLFGSTLFVHGGIPRDQTLEQRWQSLASLNDPAIRFEMLWSDPSPVDAVPRELQRASARFAFGRRQLQRFLCQTGSTLLVRGHERVLSGFEVVFDDPGARLVTLFSSGGEHNRDLPADSNYRDVHPNAMKLTLAGGITTVSPFPIDYAAFGDGKKNRFFEPGA